MKGIFFAIMLILPVLAMADDDCATRRDVPDGVQSLQDVIKLGLCRNPQTAAAYASLRASHFNKNAGYANYLPSVSAGVNASKNFAQSSDTLHPNYDWGYGASISASYLIFDI